MHPRYFIGIRLPEELSQRLSHIQNKFFMPDKTMQPLVPHITLLHPNILESLSPLYFVPKVQESANEVLPINVRLSATALFDRRVMHIAVEGEEIMTLQAQLVGLLPDKIRSQYIVGRPFTPHVTLLQAKPKQDLPPELIESVKREVEPLLPFDFSVRRLSQFRWLQPRTYQVSDI